MLKILGIICVVLGAGAVGFGCAREVRRQSQQLAALQTALCYMKNEILYRMTPLPELLEQAGREAGGVIGKLFVSLSAAMRKEPSASVAELLPRQKAKFPSLCLPEQTDRTLWALAMALGKFDAEGQCRSIDLACTRLREQVQQLDAARAQRCRSYRTIGVCAGFAIAVILL